VGVTIFCDISFVLRINEEKNPTGASGVDGAAGGGGGPVFLNRITLVYERMTVSRMV
jgi:hypothetical protein